MLVTPFLAIAVFVFVVDPFDYFCLSHVVSEAIKEKTAGILHGALWKLAKYRRSPARRLLLGDSRMAMIPAASVTRVTGHDYANLALGGGSLAEDVDIYWFAARRVPLEEVVLEVGFINFNASYLINRVPEAEAMLESPGLYLSNRLVVEAAFREAYSACSGQPIGIGIPDMTPAAFWRFEVEEATPRALRRYAYPSNDAQRLERMAADCRTNGTRLIILIPPTHVDLQAKVRELDLGAEEARFRAFVATLGSVYDFDYSNEYTTDRANFIDPYHFTNTDELIQEIWGGQVRYARITP
jgi:hypothetical protein